jgi:hypothetical protein
MDYETIVLGGGPVGIAAGAILKAPVVTDITKIPLGPVYLYDTTQTREFLSLVHKGSGKPKDISIGYAFKGKISKDLTEQAMLEYALKTKRDKQFRPKKFKYVDVDWAELMVYSKRYIPKVHIDEISKIDVEGHKLISLTGNVYHYEKLISTIPAPVFALLAGLKWKLNYLPMKLERRGPPLLWDTTWQDWTKYDYVYVCDIDKKIVRWSRNHRSKSVDGYLETIATGYDQANQYKILDGGVEAIDGITFMGRFGRWEEERFIHDDIKELLEKVKNENRMQL